MDESPRARNPPIKTQIITNPTTNKLREIEVEIDEMHVEVLSPEERVLYLEQMMTFVDLETTEVRHRIRCAWSAFAKHRQEPTVQSYLLGHQLHLFDAVVTPTVTCRAGNIRMSFAPVSFFVLFVFSLCLEDESIILCCAVRSIFRVLLL